MTQKDQQGISAFENLAQRNLLAIRGCQRKVRGKGVEFHIPGFKLRFALPSRVFGGW